MTESDATEEQESTSRGRMVERRAYPRFAVDLIGTCSIAGAADAPCTSMNMSLGGLALRCSAAVRIGDQVTVLFPQVAMLQGTVVRSFDDGFAIAFAAGRPQRERVSNYLVWLIASRDDAGIEDRVHVRLVPLRRIVTITAGGVSTTARIIDVSRSGVAVTATRSVAIDDKILVGSTPAFVVRVFTGGFAACFVECLPTTLDPTITL